MHWKLRVLRDAATLLLLAALDVRELWYKTRWLGPQDGAAFTSHASVALSAPDLPAASSNSATGWSTLRLACAELHALADDADASRFLHVRAANCSTRDGRVDAEMLLTSDIRADAMAWAACRLLLPARRPPVCHDALVTRFLATYALSAPHVTSAMLAAPMSPAERELGALLDVLASSLPLRHVVCLGGVTLPRDAPRDEPLRPVYGCASPTSKSEVKAAFVGFSAASFARLQGDKAQLAVDHVAVLGLRFVFRQSARHSYSYDASRGRVDVRTALRVSCSGELYHVLVLVDLALLLLHGWSGGELLGRLVRPLCRTPSQQELRDLSGGGGHGTLLACSLARSSPVALLTLVSTLLSWLLLLPHTAVWTSAFSSWATVHTLLSGLRVWALLLLLVHALWRVLVTLDEPRAYLVATRTRVSSGELVAAVALAALVLRHRLVAVLEDKHNREAQRLVDSTAFPGLLAVSNAFPDTLERPEGHSVLWLIYWPLCELLALSLVLVVTGLSVRYAMQERRYVVALRSMDEATVLSTIDEVAESLTPSAPTLSGLSSAQTVMATYKRLPLEQLLDEPVRALQLVRGADGGAPLEESVGDELFLWPAQYLAHGVLLENDRFLSTRRGFFRVLPAQEPMDGSSVSDSSSAGAGRAKADDGAGSPKRRRYTTLTL